MADGYLHVTVRTPHAVVYEAETHSLRVPTETGQVGFRPGAERAVLAMEAGLVLSHTTGDTAFIGTAGGLLRCDGKKIVILTPLAVAGSDAQCVIEQLDQALALPSEETEIRTTLNKLEHSILRELRGEARIHARS